MLKLPRFYNTASTTTTTNNSAGYKAVNTHLKFNEISSRLTAIRYAYFTEFGIETMLLSTSSKNVQVLVCKSVGFTLQLFREHDSPFMFHESFKTVLSVMVFQPLIKSPKIAQALSSRRGKERRKRENISILPREYRIIDFYSMLDSHQRKAGVREEY